MANSKYTIKKGNEICRLMMAGMSARKVMARKDMPNRDTLYKWLAADKVFADQYVRACDIRRSERYDQMEEEVDNTPPDKDEIAKTRLKIDVIKWQLSKEEPKKYGDKLDLSSDGEPIEPVIVFEMRLPETKKVIQPEEAKIIAK